ncbi:MAG: hypothetical protein U1F77_16450 [Kiritimatiellia bacterium]
MLYANDNGLKLIGKDKFPAVTTMTIGGGMVSPNSSRIDSARPLFSYIKDPRVFECPNDRGYSGADGAVAASSTSVYKQYGSSYAYALVNVTSCGLIGLTKSTGEGRKTTDPDFQSASNKVMMFQPCFAGPASPPKPNSKDQWHDSSNRAGVIGFMDGHSDLVKSATNHSTVPANIAAYIALNPARPYY